MECDHDWTVRFPNVQGQGGPAEFRPLTMNFNLNRSKYDYCKMKFPTEVGDMVRPQTRLKDGLFRGSTLAHICYNGEVVSALYFDPDFARYGDNYTHLEFQDLEQSMDTSVIDKKWEKISLKRAYKYVFDRQFSGLVEDIKFTLPEDMPDTIQGIGSKVSNVRSPFTQSLTQQISNQEVSATDKFVEGTYAVDIDKLSPAKAFQKLNEKFQVHTWVDTDQTLWVGIPEAFPIPHIAAPDDNRVWRYSGDEVNIRHLPQPVKQVTVEGAWVDEPDLDGVAEGIDEVTSWFGSNEKGAGDYMLQGVAYRTDIDYGDSLVFSVEGAKRNAIAGIAESQMRELMKQGHSGSVEINADLSGSYTPLQHVQPGDLLHMVPDDSHFDNPTAESGRIGNEPEDLAAACSFTNNELYFIKQVQHDVDESGYWSVSLKVGMYPDILEEENENNPELQNMESAVRYYRPDSDVYVSANTVYDGNWLEE